VTAVGAWPSVAYALVQYLVNGKIAAYAIGCDQAHMATRRSLAVETPLVLSSDTLRIAGILLLTVVAVESGGWFMLKVVRGRRPATTFQQAFFRAGHAHAGVLVILSLIGQIYCDAADLSGMLEVLARNGIWLAAILMPAGFFFSAMPRDATGPNRLIVLLYLGAVSLALGVISLGIGLLRA
jgi:Ni,Fe-hydrogenase I cytochrome b subunit